ALGHPDFLSSANPRFGGVHCLAQVAELVDSTVLALNKMFGLRIFCDAQKPCS
ncbi:MAG: hypothetical protein RIQ66_53, partial [Pseudomonadota bacterium]